jgi:4-hydroxybenzoate polyprenyltransferase
MAMQTYSAVPDIEADKKAGVSTLATKLGRVPALYFCLISYLIAAFIGSMYVGFLSIALGIVYGVIVLFTIRKPEKLFTYYTYFPLINSASGALLFFYVFIRTL